MLTESVLLALLGGIAGLVFAYAGIRFLLNLIPQSTFTLSLDLNPVQTARDPEISHYPPRPRA